MKKQYKNGYIVWDGDYPEGGKHKKFGKLIVEAEVKQTDSGRVYIYDYCFFEKYPWYHISRLNIEGYFHGYLLADIFSNGEED